MTLSLRPEIYPGRNSTIARPKTQLPQQNDEIGSPETWYDLGIARPKLPGLKHNPVAE